MRSGRSSPRGLERLAKNLGAGAHISFDRHRAYLFAQKAKVAIARTRFAYRNLASDLNERTQSTQGVEVLLDNFYIVEGALAELSASWKRKVSLRIPQSKDTEGETQPRAYLIARALVKETDARINRNTIVEFLRAYQRGAPLSLRELDIFPDMLRFTLVEEILHLLEANLSALREMSEADRWHARITVGARGKHASQNLKRLTVLLSREYAIIPQAFGLRLFHRLSQAGKEGDMRMVGKWLKLALSKQGASIAQLTAANVRAERLQTTTIASAITSLRYLAQVRWDNISLELNVVNAVLDKDPSGVFASLTAETRSRYQQTIARIADGTGSHDIEVAREAVRLAREASESRRVDKKRTEHVGYYLVEKGVRELEQALGYSPTAAEQIRTFITENSTDVYLGFMGAGTALATMFLLAGSGTMHLPLPFVLLLFIVALVLTSEIVTAIGHFLFTRILKPNPLPAIDLADGVGVARRTIVVIPSMFRDETSAERVLKRMESNFVADSDPDIFFALLMDFRDAPQETMRDDASLVSTLAEGIAKLNEHYPSAQPRFALFYRERKWNAAEKLFMGWERKRGKLREFNELLRGKTTSYVGNARETARGYGHVRYIITLDEDTELVRDSARSLIGTIDHPLNRPVIDESRKVVTEGYAIVEPRTALRFQTGNASVFARLFGNFPGIDAYSSLVSDLHQDLFGEAIFHGKGIYDIDAVEETMSDRIPENTVLSHDLLESCYARTGIASGANVFEGFPLNYREHIGRLHRWTRGDWQIIAWLFPSRGEVFSPIARYRIFDNLRRSLLPLAAVSAVVFSAFSPAHMAPWSLAALLALGSGQLVSAVLGITERTVDWRSTVSAFARFESVVVGVGVALAKTLLLGAFALHGAIVATDAILRSMWRLIVSKKRLLEWQTSYEAATEKKDSTVGLVRFMWGSVTLSLLLLSALFHGGTAGNPLAAAWIAFWIAAPFLATLVSLPHKSSFIFSAGERLYLYKVAVRTYWFFLDLATKEEQWLMPDHLQEEPPNKRHSHGLGISPTNLGMYLLALSGARTLGLSSLSDHLERIARAFASVARMDRYRGHFFNWYELKGLAPLSPRYVSTVDSANLALSLHALTGGLRGACKSPIVGAEMLEGIAAKLSVLQESSAHTSSLTTEQGERELLREVTGAVGESLALVQKAVREEMTPRQCDLLLSGVTHNALRTKNALETLRLEGKSERFDELFLAARHVESVALGYRSDVSRYLSYAMIPVASPVANSKKLHALYLRLSSVLKRIPSINEIANGKTRRDIDAIGMQEAIVLSDLPSPEKERARLWYAEVLERLSESEEHAKAAEQVLLDAATNADRYAKEMDFTFLYDRERGLFHIGYNSATEKLDDSFYDLLASEANSASIVGIAKRDVPQKHWRYLGRKLIKSGKGDTLVASWAGSLFEYLGTLIYFDVPRESFWGVSAQRAIAAHRYFARRYRIPWGMGESASSRQDVAQNYHYQAFGEPSLGYKRDLSESIVVAPYTSALALSLAPKEALANFADLTQAGGFGRYGFYDAIDFTGKRKRGGRELPGVPARTYYAHHQGFILSSIVNALTDGWVRKMVAQNPGIEVTTQLLEEKMPESIEGETLRVVTPRMQVRWPTSAAAVEVRRRYLPWRTREAISLFLARGDFHSRITTPGAGESCFGNVNITRESSDMLRESTGIFFYLYDAKRKRTWSPTFMPTKDAGDKQAVSAIEQAVLFEKTTDRIVSSLLVTPLSGEEGELRELTLTNEGDAETTLSFGVCAELSLSRSFEESFHPNYERLFVLTERHLDGQAIIASRPDPSDRNRSIVAGFLLTGDAAMEDLRAIRDKELFYGSPQSKDSPPILTDFSRADRERPLHTLDSVAAFVGRIRLRSNETRQVALVTLVGRSKEELLTKLKRYRDHKELRKTAEGTEREGARSLAESETTSSEAAAYSTLASLALSRAMQGAGETEKATPQWILPLWKMGISGARPIILLSVSGVTDLPMVRQILNCHSYFIKKGIAVDVIIYNNHSGGYLKTFEDEIDYLLYMHRTQAEHSLSAIFHVHAEQLSEGERAAMYALAAVQIDAKKGSLVDAALLLQRGSVRAYPPKLLSEKTRFGHIYAPLRGAGNTELEFVNGIGGYDPKTEEYVIRSVEGTRPPRPWSNIVANEHIGFLATDRGMSFTWTRNSYDNKLTVPYNDLLSESTGEAFYVRDDETGAYMSPLPVLCGTEASHEIRFGKGHVTYGTEALGIETELTMYADRESAVKFYRMQLTNRTQEERTLSLYGYFELLMGNLPQETRKHLSFMVKEGSTLMVKERYRHQFSKEKMFVGIVGGADEWSASREEFLGRHGDIRDPAALMRTGLSSTIDAEAEPAATLRRRITLPAGKTATTIFFLGEADEGEFDRLLKKAGNGTYAEAAFLRAKNGGAVSPLPFVTLPDPTLATLANRFLPHQIVASRVHARLGFSQIGGAFGYRDQLQDALAMLWCDPKWTRNHILAAAAHQFREGDVLAWWQPHNDFGARTRLSDPQLWLPYTTLRYVRFTGDHALLDKVIPYLAGDIPDKADRQNVVGVFEHGDEKSSLYEHLIRAVEHSLTSGAHGLPLMGSADWNDGMNKVGIEGAGESVWLAWFTVAILDEMSTLTEERGDQDRAARYRSHAKRYREALRTSGWDGRWYRRAFTDTGALVGTSGAKAFRLDSIVQSWAYFTDGPTKEAKEALHSAKDELAVYEGHVPLAWPPSSRSALDLGTISDYPPGVRENASQYNHAALWLAQALFASGDPDAGKVIVDAVNPFKRTKTKEEVAVYQGEPYAVAAEIYSAPTYPGRAGWTWYTASAGVLYRTILEYILGLTREGDALSFTPSFPSGWRNAEVVLPFGGSQYHIKFETGGEAAKRSKAVSLDRARVASGTVKLVDDGKTHEVVVVF